MTSYSRTTFSRVLFALAALPLYFALPAFAEGSFLLQLGTFETRAEADKKWTEVKNANSDVLGKLQGHVAEVMLPPDNTPTYRTQMGPVGSRKEAKTLCKSLEARNVTCFVVETAFAATDLSPEMAGDVSTPAPAPAAPVDYTPPPEPKAVSPAEQISSAPVAPIEAAPTPVAQPAEPLAAAPVAVASAAPVTQKTKVRAARSKAGGRFNPNDMKKSGFFRGTFNIDDQDSQDSEETVATAPAPVKEPVVLAKASSEEDDKPGFFGRLFGSSPKKVEPKPAPVKIVRADTIRGNVEVSEAIRVPVTENAPDTANNYVPVAVNGDETVTADAEGNGAFWVQVGYFDNETAAHNFYLELQGEMPKAFANTRVRITRPFATRNSRASLRMGVFSQASDVKAICGQAKSRGMRCTSIRDTGADSYAAPAKASTRNGGETVRKRYPSPLEAVDIPAYHGEPAIAPAGNATMASYTPASVAAAVEKPVTGGQWVSLGGFATAQSAWNHWKTLQSTIPQLRDVKSTISGTIGRNNSEKYQLRAGPIVTDVDAENICKAVVNTGNSCSVVGAE